MWSPTAASGAKWWSFTLLLDGRTLARTVARAGARQAGGELARRPAAERPRHAPGEVECRGGPQTRPEPPQTADVPPEARTKISDDPGPIVAHLPEAPDGPTRMLLVEKLGGHTTSSSFLPEGLHPKLDELRGELLRLRGQAVSVLEERATLLAGFEAEDKRQPGR